MGLFDRVRCSYPINEHFNNNMLQTKGLSNSLAEYWISPAGELFEIDDYKAADFVEVDEFIKEADSLVSSLRLPPVPGSKPGTKGSIRLPRQNADVVIDRAYRRDQKDFTLKDWVSSFADRLESIK